MTSYIYIYIWAEEQNLWLDWKNKNSCTVLCCFVFLWFVLFYMVLFYFSVVLFCFAFLCFVLFSFDLCCFMLFCLLSQTADLWRVLKVLKECILKVLHFVNYFHKRNWQLQSMIFMMVKMTKLRPLFKIVVIFLLKVSFTNPRLLLLLIL